MKNRSLVGTGSISLVLIFSVLCLVTFSLMTLYNAKNEMKLSDKLANSAENYYAADTQGVEVYAKINEYLKNGEAVPEFIDDVEIEQYDNGFRFKCDIDEQRYILVSLVYDDGELSVVGWKETEGDEWIPDTSINVLK